MVAVGAYELPVASSIFGYSDQVVVAPIVLPALCDSSMEQCAGGVTCDFLVACGSTLEPFLALYAADYLSPPEYHGDGKKNH